MGLLIVYLAQEGEVLSTHERTFHLSVYQKKSNSISPDLVIHGFHWTGSV